MKPGVLWVAALGCGAVAGCTMWFWLQGLEAEARGSSSEKPVLVTTRDIPQGTWLTPAFVELRRVPKRYSEPTTLSAMTELTTDQGKPTYAAAVPLSRGEHLTLSKLAPVGKQRGLAALLPVGKVAASLMLSPARGAGGWIRPGDHIDLFCTLEGEGASDSATVPFLQDVSVLAVGDRLLGDPDDSKRPASTDASVVWGEAEQPVVLTVAVESGEVGKLVLAREKGLLSVVLRPIGQTAILPPLPIPLSSLVPSVGALRHSRQPAAALGAHQQAPASLRVLQHEIDQTLRQLP